jgi:hypothetical protein
MKAVRGGGVQRNGDLGWRQRLQQIGGVVKPDSVGHQCGGQIQKPAGRQYRLGIRQGLWQQRFIALNGDGENRPGAPLSG